MLIQYSMLWMNCLMIGTASITFFYGFFKCTVAGPGFMYLMKRSARARKLFLISLIFMYISFVVVFVFPFPPEPFYVYRAAMTYTPFIITQIVVMSMFVDSAETIRKGGRRKTD